MTKFKFMSDVDETVVAAINRYCWPRWEAKADALKRVRYVERKGKKSVWFSCEVCGKRGLQRDDVHVHHINPRMPSTGWDNLCDYANRTLCEASGLLVVCKDCHKEIHKGDAKVRSENKKAKPRKASKGRK